MFVSIDLCLVPIGVGTSLSPYIKECIEVIKSEGLNYELGANGTAKKNGIKNPILESQWK